MTKSLKSLMAIWMSQMLAEMKKSARLRQKMKAKRQRAYEPHAYELMSLKA